MNTAILYPVFAQIGLTFFLLCAVGWTRRQALIARETTQAEIALDDSRWPEGPRKVANCYANQFELPIVFYALCLMASMTASAGIVMIGLAWAFVASRVAHAYIHTHSNHVPTRGAVFAAGFFIVGAMTLLLLGTLLLGGGA